mmetsp:Transcript_4965/g.12873  ORF Transcript_4965/g.12873 Transcript_4965/m.12873 type:complete len:264 (+) Transcript_4965:86-877(+)
MVNHSEMILVFVGVAPNPRLWLLPSEPRPPNYVGTLAFYKDEVDALRWVIRRESERLVDIPGLIAAGRRLWVHGQPRIGEICHLAFNLLFSGEEPHCTLLWLGVKVAKEYLGDATRLFRVRNDVPQFSHRAFSRLFGERKVNSKDIHQPPLWHIDYSVDTGTLVCFALPVAEVAREKHILSVDDGIDGCNCWAFLLSTECPWIKVTHGRNECVVAVLRQSFGEMLHLQAPTVSAKALVVPNLLKPDDSRESPFHNIGQQVHAL